LLFLLGAIVGAYNIWMTARSAPEAVDTSASDRPISGPAAEGVPEPAE
jgi:cytochrome c oxidase cbb3-type subunit 1